MRLTPQELKSKLGLEGVAAVRQLDLSVDLPMTWDSPATRSICRRVPAGHEKDSLVLSPVKRAKLHIREAEASGRKVTHDERAKKQRRKPLTYFPLKPHRILL